MDSNLYEFFYGQGSINHKLFMLLNHSSCPLLDAVMSVLNPPGDTRNFLICFLILLMVLSLVNRELIPRKYLMIYFFAAILSFMVKEYLKHLFHIPRPASAIGIESVRVIGQIKMDNNSLPSGHATIFFMSAFVLSYGRNIYWKILFFLFALFVSYSTIYVGLHYPLDVVVGAIIGVFLGLFTWEVCELIESYCKKEPKKYN